MSIHEFGMRNIDKDELTSKLEEEVAALKRENEIQALYLVGGFKSVLRVKDEEKKRLALENAELRRTVIGRYVSEKWGTATDTGRYTTEIENHRSIGRVPVRIGL